MKVEKVEKVEKIVKDFLSVSCSLVIVISRFELAKFYHAL